jgi:hypothetical protein
MNKKLRGLMPGATKPGMKKKKPKKPKMPKM